jgi:transposase-like protein
MDLALQGFQWLCCKVSFSFAGRLKMTTRPAIFKWRQTEPELSLCALCWYLRFSLSLRDVKDLLEERGLEAVHTTVWRWVQRYGPELE